MKSLIVIITVFLLSIFSASAEHETVSTMKRWVESYNKNDWGDIAKFYDVSEETDCLISAGIWRKGYKEIAEMYKVDMQEVRFYDSVSEGMKTRLLGDTAVVSFVHKFKYEIRESSLHYRIHIRTTATLHKFKDVWKIVSEHSSPILGIERAVVIQH